MILKILLVIYILITVLLFGIGVLVSDALFENDAVLILKLLAASILWPIMLLLAIITFIVAKLEIKRD